MKIFGKPSAEDPAVFWRETAAKRGGTIGFLTFASLLGGTADGMSDTSGILYTVGESVWFEDFERNDWLRRIAGGKSTFVKTEITFTRSEVAFTRLVTRGAALACIAGKVPPADLSAASRLARLLGTPFVEVGMRDGSALFLDVIRRSEFMAVLGGASVKPASLPG